MPEAMDTHIDQFGGVAGELIIVAAPKTRMTRAEALRHAAWLVAIADESDDQEAFLAQLEAIRAT